MCKHKFDNNYKKKIYIGKSVKVKVISIPEKPFKLAAINAAVIQKKKSKFEIYTLPI